MNWRIEFSELFIKILSNNNVDENLIVDKISLVIKKLQGAKINIDVKKLKGDWEGFYRIRSGKIRIIVEFNFASRIVFIEAIDWRGNI